MSRASTSDAFNSIQLACLDRANQYNEAVVAAKDQALIDNFGLRETTIQSHIFANLAAGRLSAQLQLQKQARRNQYAFTLDHRYVFLDPMDLVSLTVHRADGTKWLDKKMVRILTIDESEDGYFDMVAEEFASGSSSAPTHTFQSSVGFVVDYAGSSGNANTPVIFEPPVQISQTGGLEVNVAASGGANWGGCEIWISTDGSTYKFADRTKGSARQGVLNGSLASGSDPDITNTLHADLTMSAGQLLSGTQADADGNHTLCYVDGEYISYRTATLTAANKYDLTYLRRGQFGSTISSHNSGKAFARMDGGILAIPYDKSKIGTQIYIKILGYNIYGGGLQALADVSPYTYAITGPQKPAQVQNFQAQQQGNVVVCNWTDLAYEGGLKGYDIAFGAVGSLWANKQILTQAHRGTEMTNASVPPGNWEISIRAHDIADNLGVESIQAITVTNQDQVITQTTNEPDWLGSLTNLYRHYTGVLTPTGSKTVDQYSALSAPSAPTLGTTAGGALALTTYYAKITYVDAGGESLPSAESSQAVLLNNLLTVASPIASGLATSYNVYVSTSAGTETLQATVPIGTNWTEPTTGLVSGAALPTANTTGWQVFNQFVPDVVSSASYIAPTIDAAIDGSVRVYATTGYGLGYGQTGTPTLQFLIDTWLTAGSDLGVFVDWVIGYVTMRYLRAEIALSAITQGAIPYLTDFTTVIDSPPNVENAVVTIAPGGTTVTFPLPFHSAPYVNPTAIGASGNYAEASSITPRDCIINVYNSAGSSVGGSVSYSATGE